MSRIIILMYHIIDHAKTSREANLCCSPESFKKQIKYLANSNYTLVNLDDVSNILNGTKVFENDVVALTFDDGFEDFYLNALPILTQYKIPSTLFVVSNQLGNTNNWMSERNFPARKLISKQQLITIKESGVVIGSHTRSHLKLNELSDDRALIDQEIKASKIELEEILKQPVKHFAYPFGKFNDIVVDTVQKADYTSACTTKSGFNRENADPLLLRRIEIYNSDNLWRFKFKLKLGTNDMTLGFLFNYFIFRLKLKLASN